MHVSPPPSPLSSLRGVEAETLISAVCTFYSSPPVGRILSLAQLRSPGDEWPRPEARQMVCYLLDAYALMPQRQIGALLHRDQAAVSRLAQRVAYLLSIQDLEATAHYRCIERIVHGGSSATQETQYWRYARGDVSSTATPAHPRASRPA